MLYTIKYGDSLNSIASAFNTAPALLSQLNQLNPHVKPVSGQALYIPSTKLPVRSVTVHGIIHPAASEKVLAAAAPYLTFASIGSGCISENGSITLQNHSKLVQHAHMHGIAPLLRISSMDNPLIHSILQNKAAIDALIEALISILHKYKYAGVNFDMGTVSPDAAASYPAFLETIAQALHNHGYVFFISLRPPYDLIRFCACADKVIISAECMRNYAGSPMPLSPIVCMHDALKLACLHMPSRNVIAELPWYGRNFALSTIENTCQTVQLSAVPLIACNNYADILYDVDSQSPYFRYYDSIGTEHAVWFHDGRSISARLDLVQQYDLGGISIDNIASYYRTGFLLLEEKYNTHKLK